VREDELVRSRLHGGNEDILAPVGDRRDRVRSVGQSYLSASLQAFGRRSEATRLGKPSDCCHVSS